jgi:hypothetical protein
MIQPGGVEAKIEGSVSDPSVEAYNDVNATATTIQSLCK